MRKRKLITMETLSSIVQQTDIGVPLQRAMDNYNIDMSRPAVAKLVEHYKTANKTAERMLKRRLYDSLFPDWLIQDGQEQPDHATYDGYFPLGYWTYNEEH